MSRRSLAIASVVGALALSLTGCGSGEATSTAASVAVESGGVASVAVESGRIGSPPDTPDGDAGEGEAGALADPTAIEPLRVVAPAVAGGTADLSVYGSRPTVFWFWAPG